MKTFFFMKKLTKFELTSEFEDNKVLLQTYEDYAALTEDERKVYFKEIPDMVDIALWDNTDGETVIVSGYDYNDGRYPTDRYTPIGVVVIPKNHIDNIHSKIMSLKYMDYNYPIIGNDNVSMQFGLMNQAIEGMNYPSYVGAINESGTTEFGEEQEIKYWAVPDGYDRARFPSDAFTDILNPFAKNQGYGTNRFYHPLLPSPYLTDMRKNELYNMENPNTLQPCLNVNMDGKEESNKILNQLAVNIGNENWKTGTTIPPTTSETLDWSMVCPPVQCAWMYCIDENYKNNPIFGQGQWYIPTIAEMGYVMSRYNAINNTLNHIEEIIGNTTFPLSGINHTTISLQPNNTMWCLNLADGEEFLTIRYNGSVVRAFCIV